MRCNKRGGTILQPPQGHKPLACQLQRLLKALRYLEAGKRRGGEEGTYSQAGHSQRLKMRLYHPPPRHSTETTLPTISPR